MAERGYRHDNYEGISAADAQRGDRGPGGLAHEGGIGQLLHAAGVCAEGQQ